MRSDVVKTVLYPRRPLSGRSLPYFGNDTMSVMNICITDQRLWHPMLKVLRAIGSVSSPALDSVEKVRLRILLLVSAFCASQGGKDSWLNCVR